ncbi:LysR family transcriptional regulator [Motiliproteus sp.]|uniref:LysR family transcriptional regulator n=1 Tax=Motiliproteus sp. TaxID=1898955 RepID=UPI003BAB120C
MERLNLNLLRALATLLEEKNVTQASVRLHLTQSAMSRQLAQLRDYFDDPLLIREGNSYHLSARAIELLPRVQSILSQADGLRQLSHFDPASCDRQFSFACTDYVAQFIFPHILNRLQREAPGISFSYELWKPQSLSRLGQLPLDFVSTTISTLPANLQSIFLGKDQPVCLMAAKHPLATEARPSLDALLAYPFVRVNSGGDKDSFFERALESQGLSRQILFEVPFFSAAFQVVAQGRALMILPAHIARNAANALPLSYCELPLALPEHHYHLCWHLKHDRDPAHGWVRNCIADEIKASMYSPKFHDLKS